MTLMTVIIPALVCLAGVQQRVDLDRCGARCLEVALYALQHPEAGNETVDKLLGSPTERGYSLGQLQSVAEGLNLQTRLVRTSLDNLQRREPGFVCLIPLKGDHFVLLGDCNARDAWIVDPPGEYTLAVELLTDRWDGTALLISNRELVAEEHLRLRWRTWVLVVLSVVAVFSLVAWRVRPRR